MKNHFSLPFFVKCIFCCFTPFEFVLFLILISTAGDPSEEDISLYVIIVPSFNFAILPFPLGRLFSIAP